MSVVSRIVRYVINGTRPFIMLLLLICICAASFRIFGREPEVNIRWTGATLQIVGFLIALVDLESTRKIMGGPNFIEAWKAFFRNFPIGREPITLSGNMTLGGVMSGRLKVGHNSDAAIPDRVSRLEADIERIEDEVADLAKKAEADSARLTKQIEEGLSGVRNDLRELASKVKDALAGGYFMQWVGLAYFVVGVILASASVELACQLFRDCPT